MQKVPNYAQSILGLAVLLIICESSAHMKSSFGSDLESWTKIFGAVCVSPTIRDEETALRFYECYGVLNEREQCLYKECQKEVFGVVLQSLEQIQKACDGSKPDSLNLYIGCLTRKYKKEGRDYDSAAAAVNICDAKVLGLE